LLGNSPTLINVYVIIFPVYYRARMISDLDKEVLILLGKNLKKIRLAKKLTYRKMAQLCNVDYGDIQKIESGKVNITFLTLRELAKALDEAPHKLLEFEGASKPQPHP